MDDQLAVGMAHRGESLAKEQEPLFGGEMLLVAVCRDRHSFDVFHDKERFAVAGRPAVEQSRDVVVFERRQDLAFTAKARRKFAAVIWPANTLDRHALVKGAIGAHRFVDLTHAAPAEKAGQAKVCNRCPGAVLPVFMRRQVVELKARLLDVDPIAGGRGEEGEDLRLERPVTGRFAGHRGRPRSRRFVCGDVEDFANASPLVGRHCHRFNARSLTMRTSRA